MGWIVVQATSEGAYNKENVLLYETAKQNSFSNCFKKRLLKCCKPFSLFENAIHYASLDVYVRVA